MPIYTIKIWKSYGGLSSQGQWSNQYHVNCAAPIGDADIDAIVQKFFEAERAIHTDYVYFDRAVVSTFIKEGAASTGEDFRVIGLNALQGEATASPEGTGREHSLPLDLVLIGTHGGGGGRQGRNSFRGAVTNEMWQTVDGKAKLTASMVTKAGVWTSKLVMQDDWKWVIPSVNTADGMPGRNVMTFSFSGIGSKQRVNNRKKSDKVPTSVEGILELMESVASAQPLATAAVALLRGKLSGEALTAALANLRTGLAARGLSEAAITAIVGAV